MGILRSAKEKRFHVSQQPPGWVVKGYGWDSYTGEEVNPDTALGISAAYACITILAETIASLPLILYRRKGRGKERATDHPLYALLHDAPNKEHSSMVFRELLQGHLGGWGNGYGQIIRNGAGQVAEIWPLRPDRMEKVERVNGERRYTYKRGGTIPTPYKQSDIWHVQGFGSDGLMGLSPVALARNELGVAIAAEKYGGRVFQNDARPTVVMMHPNTMSDAAWGRLEKNWKDTYGGADNAGKFALLEEGATIETIGFPPEQSQFLETQKFAISQVARWYKIPLSLLGEHDKASTYASVEQFMLSFVIHTIRPWVVRWEQSINTQLLTEKERKAGYYSEFLLDALLRGDTTARFEAYAKGIQNGFFCINDVRLKENLDEVEGGDTHFIPLNLIPLGQAGQYDPSGDVGELDAMRSLSAPEETREARDRQYQAGLYRHRLAGAQIPALTDAAGRVIRRERNDIMAALKKRRAYPINDFMQWFDKFYEEHSDFAAGQLLPVLESYARMINSAVSDELGWDRAKVPAEALRAEGMDLPPELQKFLESYARTYGTRHILRSKAWLAEWLEKNWGLVDEEFFEGIQEFFDGWQADRPGREALEESVRASNAIAKSLYVLAGVLKIRSIAFGDSCPYCNALNGKVVGIEEYYIKEGDEFQPDGADRPLTVSRGVKHAPYHGGCDCMNVAEL